MQKNITKKELRGLQTKAVIVNYYYRFEDNNKEDYIKELIFVANPFLESAMYLIKSHGFVIERTADLDRAILVYNRL